MSPEQIALLIGLGQLLIAILVWAGVDARFLRKVVPPMSGRSKLVGLLLLGGLAFSLFGFYRTLPDGINSKNIQPKLREWLSSFGLGFTETTIIMPSDFAFNVSLTNGRRVVIFKSTRGEYRSFLTVQGNVGVSPEHLRALRAMRPEQALRIVRGLGVALATAKLGFTMVGTPLDEIAVEKHIPITNDLNENVLLQAIDEVDGAQLLVIQTILRDIGQ